jgi:hypothetical protein
MYNKKEGGKMYCFDTVVVERLSG